MHNAAVLARGFIHLSGNLDSLYAFPSTTAFQYNVLQLTLSQYTSVIFSPELLYMSPFFSSPDQSFIWSRISLAPAVGECCRPKASTKSPSGSIR